MPGGGMKAERLTLNFLASLPPIQGAIKQGPDAMRIVLEVPGTEVPKALGILTMHGKVLDVTVKAVKASKGQQSRTSYGV